MTSNQLAYWRNVETKRANLAAEMEARRHNMESEAIGRGQVAASFAATAAQRAAIASNERIASMNLAETARYHDASLSELASYHSASVAATERGQTLSLIGSMYSTNETTRHNKALEESTNLSNTGRGINSLVGAGATLAGLLIGSSVSKATKLPTWQRP